MVYMKISAISPQVYFNGSDKNYRETVKEKSNTTLKLAIGTAVAGAGLLAVYYLSRGSKGAARAIGQKSGSSTQAAEKPKETVNEFVQEIIEKNGRKIVKNRTYNGNTEKIEKLFYDKNGKKIKKQQAVTELAYTMNIPTGYKKTVTVLDKDKKTIQRITYSRMDGKPLQTVSNGKTILYFYDGCDSDKLLAHAFSKNDKFVLKLENNKEFKKEFSDTESLYKWIKENF